MNKDIEVEPLEYSGGKLNKETGLITWKQRIEPSAEKKFRVSFAVKYPKDQKDVYRLMLSCASYLAYSIDFQWIGQVWL